MCRPSGSGQVGDDVKFRNLWVGLALSALVLGTIGAGIYFRHYFVVFVFAVWISVELTLSWVQGGWGKSERVKGPLRVRSMSHLVELYGTTDTVSEAILDRRIAEFKAEGTLTDYEFRWLARLRDLVELRGLVFGPLEKGRRGLRQNFTFSTHTEREARFEPKSEGFTIQDITESATVVADLYWKLYDTAVGAYPDLSVLARKLYTEIFGHAFSEVESRALIGKLTDIMQREGGASFCILNCVRIGQADRARVFAQDLIANDVDIDPDVRSALYWISEIYWFTKQNDSVIRDFDSTIRYLYHLCFTNPERAGFLEIDSQFFSQFETVAEIAREGFLFKETLVDKILSLWRDNEEYFDKTFQSVLEAMTQRKSKIYDERETWDRFWSKERDKSSRDYLFVVEGNIFYANGHYREALESYERALDAQPRLRSAQLNRIFCFARLKMKERHQMFAEKLVTDRALLPSALYVAGNSFLLTGDVDKAERYYHELTAFDGWKRKVDYYKSTFCFENGLYEMALRYARKAHETSPEDSSISYHLSLCYNAVGEKDQALDMVKRVKEMPQWLNYYRFTLERDAGREHEASQTLLQIPSSYFEDPEELEQALEFARRRQDLNLLRHLRRKA